MFCEVCKQDIGRGKQHEESDKVVKIEGLGYTRVVCPYCGSEYFLLEDNPRYIVLDTKSRNYEMDLNIAKTVATAKIQDSSYSEVSATGMPEFIVVDYRKRIIPIRLNEGYQEDGRLWANVERSTLICQR